VRTKPFELSGIPFPRHAREHSDQMTMRPRTMSTGPNALKSVHIRFDFVPRVCPLADFPWSNMQPLRRQLILK
jgi:hypothetical protein